MEKDTLYIDREGGQFWAYTYSDSWRITLARTDDKAVIYRYARKHNYRVVDLTIAYRQRVF